MLNYLFFISPFQTTETSPEQSNLQITSFFAYLLLFLTILTLYYGLPETTLHPLTKVFDNHARSVSATHKFSRLISTFTFLNWLFFEKKISSQKLQGLRSFIRFHFFRIPSNST